MVYLGLGANLGDREAQIAAALDKLERAGEVERVSPLYETAHIGLASEPAPAHLNCVAEVRTLLEPELFLVELQEIEREIGLNRAEKRRWGSRVIDIDILLFGERQMASPPLTIPHPELSRRRFVLEPLAELAPDLVIPGLGKSVSQLLGAVADQDVRRVGWSLR